MNSSIYCNIIPKNIKKFLERLKKRNGGIRRKNHNRKRTQTVYRAYSRKTQKLSDERRNLNVYDKVIEPDHDIKALFHCWHPVTGNAGIEYEDGTVHEVEPTQIRFVDNAMSEYVFPEMED